MFAEARAALDRRLDPRASQPIAVAFSGGGDSLATLIAVLDWARPRGRPVIALTVDHRLQPESAQWTDFAGRTARRLDASFEGLAWDDAKPLTGLPAAARLARHRLLAGAASRLGARVIVTGHTADDAAENAVLGQGRLFEWSPSPVWPEGRDLFLLRPLLSQRREAIRAALRLRGETWIDDPANADPASPRVRARQSNPPLVTGSPSLASGLAQAFDTSAGAFRAPRAWLHAAAVEDARRVIAAAVVSAGGGDAPPRGARLATLVDRLRGAEPFAATLCGAKVAAGDDILITRNAGEAARGGLLSLVLEPGKAVVWDGRYEIEAPTAGLTVAALRGHAGRLPRAERAKLACLPAAARPGLPVILGGPEPTCPILAADPPPVRFRALAATRFLAACGAIAQEMAADGPRHGAKALSVLC